MEDTRSAQPEPTSTHSPHNTRKDLLAQLGNAVKNAERQALENGVVNIVEVYDKDAHEPSRVEMPPGFQPDQHVDFQPGSTDFLDITTTNKEQPTDVFDGMSRREYLDSLIETEREGEAEELLNDTEQCEDHLKKEEQEFGKGFAKGFFGAPPIQQPSKASSIKSIPNDNPHVTRPVAAPEPDAPFVEELQEIPAVQEKVVEKRKPSRRSAKRNRRKRPQVTPQVPYIPAVDESEGTEQEHPSPQFLPEEDVVEEEDSSVSKFRQLRNFEKAQPNGVQR